MSTDNTEITPVNPPTNPAVTVSPVPTPIGTTTVPISHGEKPEKFNGTEFKRWQQKMLFYLTTLHLARYIREEVPKPKEGETADFQLVAAIDAWKQGDFFVSKLYPQRTRKLLI